MNVPYSWLGEFFAEPLPPVDEVADLLTGIGLATEDILDYPGAAPGTVAVRLDEVSHIEGTDQLSSARAWDGSRHFTVITAAPNVRDGIVTAFAPPGTRLESQGITIGTREMAGVRSEGMLLSPRELGVYDHAGGLIELPGDVEPGADLAGLWPPDRVIELELTANRSDAFSIRGVARDLAAKLDRRLIEPTGVQVIEPEGTSAGGLSVHNHDEAGAPLFSLRRISGVTPAPSPVWLQRRLGSIGQRPRNNIVDVTNLVMFELGQPTHAYDMRALPAGELHVRRAGPGESFTTLADDSLELDPADLVLSGGGDAIGLAGVIGGMHDSVVEDTSEVALEVAHFDPHTVRATARRHGLHTDAHLRFERGTDPALPYYASARAAALIAELAGGSVHPQLAASGSPGGGSTVAFAPSRVEFLTTLQVEADTQQKYLEALGCKVERRGEDDWLVSTPSWRVDLNICEDLVEEVARLHGYEHIGTSVPHMHFTPPLTDPTHRRLRARLAGAGFQELISYVFTGEAELSRTKAPPSVVQLAEPQGVERAVLRTALYPGLLAAAALNRARDSLALFELGSVFLEQEGERLVMLTRGPWVGSGWRGKAEPGSVFVLKGQLERLARSMGSELEFRNEEHPPLHPGVSAGVYSGGVRIGFIGQIHPEIASSFELPDTWVAELDLPLPEGTVGFKEPVRQPHSQRDIALVTPQDVSFASLDDLLRPAAGEHLVRLEPFDVYRDGRLGAGNQSIALRFTFRDSERALRDEEVSAAMSNVIRVAKHAGYDVRDG